MKGWRRGKTSNSNEQGRNVSVENPLCCCRGRKDVSGLRLAGRIDMEPKKNCTLTVQERISLWVVRLR